MNHPPADGQHGAVPELARATQWRIAIGLLVLVVAAFWLVPKLWHALSPAPPPPQAAPDDGSFTATDQQWQTLGFARVQDSTIATSVVSDGRIAVDDNLSTPVYSPFTGKVTRILMQAGDPVTAGQPLFAVAASEAAQSDVDIASAVAQVKLTRAAEARQHDLYNNKGAALKDWQQAQADLATAEANLSAAGARRRALGGSVAHGEGIVRAPVAGIVTQRLIGPGQNVASAAGGSATQAFTIANFARVWLIGNLREEDAARARVGQIAVVTLPNGETLQAPLSYVAPAIDPATLRLTVRAEIANPDGRLKPETYTSFTLLTGQPRQGLTVPEAAVIFEGSTARVWIVAPGQHRLALRQIATGQVANDKVEVTSGLKAGDIVVTAGSLFIDRGAKAD